MVGGWWARRKCAFAHPTAASLHQRQLAIDHQQDTLEFVAAAQDQAGRRDHAVHALLARQPRILFDPVDRHFGSAAEDRKHRAVFQEVDGVVAPFAVGDHAPIQIEDTVEFETIERDTIWRWNRSGGARHCAALAWIGVLRYRAHGAPPVHPTYMIALTAGGRKGRKYKGNRGGGPILRKHRFTGSLAESYCCPTSANRPPR